MRQSDEPERDQHRLHAWPEWDTSIEWARERLAFDPAWTPAPGKTQSADYARWRNGLHPRRLDAEARRAITDLRLPERFIPYWRACFLAPYQRDGFAVIREPRANGDIGKKRVFPPPAALWFEAGVDISTAPATLVIEGPAALASSALLRLAERRALEDKRRLGLTRQHPLIRSRQIGPALDDRARARAMPNAARDKAIRSARAWRKDGEKPIFIADRLAERGYRVSERTVRRWTDVGTDSDKI